MDVTFNPEQLQFAEAVARWAARDYDFATRSSIVHGAGTSQQARAQLAELGMLALPVPAEHGGFDGTAVDLFGVMQELGRALVVEPYLATVMGAECLKQGGAHGALLEQVATGELTLACAWGERESRYDMRAIATTARENGAGYVLDGAKTVVIHGAEAGALIVSALMDDDIGLLVVPLDTPGVTVTAYRTLDGLRGADIRFTDVKLGPAARIGPAAGGWAILEAVLDYGATLLCAEALGAMEALFAATLDYLKTRQQFGAPLGKFQALQHRMADMAIHLEQARSMALLAAWTYADGRAEDRRRIVSAAKYRVGEAARYIGQQAVQLHGGMGVTDELPASHYFKRLTMIELTLGNGDYHLQRFIAQPAFTEGTRA